MRLVPRLIAIQVLVDLSVVGLIALLAPRLLLLEHHVAHYFILPAIEVAAAFLLFSVLTTLVITRRLRATLHGIAKGDPGVEPTDLLAIDSLPARLAIAKVVTVCVFSSSLAIPWIVTVPYDLYMTGALAALLITFTSAASLPLYVFLRSSVARVLECAPLASAHAAIEVVERLPPDRVPRVRTRFLLAVVAPVAFVALGAGLLVYAHVRSFEIHARTEIGVDLATGVFDLVEGHSGGRDDAIHAAQRLGYRVTFHPVSLPKESTEFRNERERRVIVPVSDGNIDTTFDTAQFSTATAVYVILAAIASLLAGVIGANTGARFTSDLAIATKSIRTIGVEDVIKGTKMVQGARFRSVVQLLHSIDSLGDVFRRFASAHERSIVARKASERMRGLFLASMSHDLKAPLNAILGFTELVRRKSLSSEQEESLKIIEQRGRELLHLIHTILDSARLEDGSLELHHEWSVASDVVMSAVLDARELSAGAEVTITADMQRDLPMIHVDPQRTVQALTSIIVTAAHFAPRGSVTVRATLPPSSTLEPSDRLRIDIETRGGDVSADEREKLFDAFQHAERARRHGGLGLGLALARTIVERQNGTITVENTAGRDLVFQVWLTTTPGVLSLRRPSLQPRAT